MPAFQSALYLILTDDMFPPDLLQELVSLLAPDTVFSPLVQHCQHQAGQPQVPVSAVVSVQADGCEDQLGVSPSGSGQPSSLIRPLAC